ncbi:hypothetical protein N0V90_011265 [Kalmusia sp. IMI 367209]|nr:hypothetical protein N0V90_011265 [Kalmusia sp. IMI 367209]
MKTTTSRSDDCGVIIMAPLQINPSSFLANLSFTLPSASVDLPNDIGYGSTSQGGFITSLLVKYALLYSTQKTEMAEQSDVRSALVQFYRPIFPTRGPVMITISEINIGRVWSTLRVEVYQGSKSKLATSADVCLTKFTIAGRTIESPWKLDPPAPAVDFAKLSADTHANWTSYHTAFHPGGYRRASSYIKNYIPVRWPSHIKYIEQWIVPGWDCSPQGSRDGLEARWTNELLHFALDPNLPVQENFVTSKGNEAPLPASIAATLRYAQMQKAARDAGADDWRSLPDDGSLAEDGSSVMSESLVHATMSISTEIKKILPKTGMRWLYLRSEVKSIQNGRMDMTVLLFDEERDLVAISQQVLYLIAGTSKTFGRDIDKGKL